MKKFIFLPLALCAVLLCGCASGVVSMGKDTYMVARRGTVYTPEFSLEAKCLKDANKFCQKRGEAMVFVSKSGHDGGFGQMSSCEVIFRAVPTNSPLNVSPELGGEHLVH